MLHLFIYKINSPEISGYIQHFGYIGIFLFFITVDQLTPIPEEITLLTIGYFASTPTFNPFLAGAISIFAFLTVDIAYFFLAKSGNHFFKKLYEKLKDTAISKYKEKLKHNFAKTLIILCFIPRMRMMGPIFSGILNLSIKKFALFDTIGLCLFTATYLSLGIIFHSTLQSHIKLVEKSQHVIFFGALLVVGILIIYFTRKSHKSKSA